jgi:hypothetical protein
MMKCANSFCDADAMQDSTFCLRCDKLYADAMIEYMEVIDEDNVE